MRLAEPVGSLFNPSKVIGILKSRGRLYLLALMISPFLEPIIYGHVSLVLGAISLGAFVAIVQTVVVEGASPLD